MLTFQKQTNKQTGFVADGHEGDTLRYMDLNGNSLSNYSPPFSCWGCSHSMDERLVFSTAADDFAPVCVSDCYASQAVLLSDSTSIYSLFGNCAGETDGGLGGLIETPNGFAISFVFSTCTHTHTFLLHSLRPLTNSKKKKINKNQTIDGY